MVRNIEVWQSLPSMHKITGYFMTYDKLNGTNQFSHLYTADEKALFERRLEMRIDHSDEFQLQSFLAMYANPVVNKMKLEDAS